MNGGVSHLETFDPKPELDKYAGKTIPETPYKDVQSPERLKKVRVVVVNDANGQQRNKIYPLQIGSAPGGKSGIAVSDWFPHLRTCVDDLAIVRSMWTTDSNHGAQTQFHTGRHMLDPVQPTLGGWVHYGLGSLNDDLPQFISMGTREYWNKRDGHYLGPAHDAVPMRVDPASPLDFGPLATSSAAVIRSVTLTNTGAASVTITATPTIASQSGGSGSYTYTSAGSTCRSPSADTTIVSTRPVRPVHPAFSGSPGREIVGT